MELKEATTEDLMEEVERREKEKAKLKETPLKEMLREIFMRQMITSAPSERGFNERYTQVIVELGLHCSVFLFASEGTLNRLFGGQSWHKDGCK